MINVIRAATVPDGRVVILLLVLLPLAACSPPEEIEGADDANTIVFATHMGEHAGWLEGFAAVIRGYRARHPNVNIKLHYQPLLDALDRAHEEIDSIRRRLQFE